MADPAWPITDETVRVKTILILYRWDEVFFQQCRGLAIAFRIRYSEFLLL